MNEQKALAGMATARMIAGCIEMAAAILMLRFGSVRTALKINATLGLIGPAILLTVSTLGLVSIAVKLHPLKVAIVTLGVLMIFLGTR